MLISSLAHWKAHLFFPDWVVEKVQVKEPEGGKELKKSSGFVFRELVFSLHPEDMYCTQVSRCKAIHRFLFFFFPSCEKPQQCLKVRKPSQSASRQSVRAAVVDFEHRQRQRQNNAEILTVYTGRRHCNEPK